MGSASPWASRESSNERLMRSSSSLWMGGGVEAMDARLVELCGGDYKQVCGMAKRSWEVAREGDC